MIQLLCLIVGLLLGFWAERIYTKVSQLTSYFKDRLEAPPGVVKPTGRLIANQPSTGDTGGVLRPTPNDLALQSMVENERIKNEKLRG